MEPVGFGVIGARSFVAEAAVLPAMVASDLVDLRAASSLSGSLDRRWVDVTVDSYEDVLAHPDVEAVYIPLPNHLHLEWIERCATAGKHVLCEKPLALSQTDARRAADVCAGAGVMLAEAWATPFHKRWQLTMLHASSGQLGSPQEVNTRFTFTIDPANGSNYRFGSSMGGGALYDVGIYCLGPAVKLWGAEPETVEVLESASSGGVDMTTEFRLTWEGGQIATGRCSFVEPEEQALEIRCRNGTISVPGQPHTGGDPEPSFTWSEPAQLGSAGHRVPCPPNDPYQTMVERFAQAVRSERDWPRPMTDTIAMTTLIDRIRAEL